MVDREAAQKLKSYIEKNTYPGQIRGILKTLTTSRAIGGGVYKREHAIEAFQDLASTGARRYAREHGGNWKESFSEATRDHVAEEWAAEFDTEYARGKYKELLPANIDELRRMREKADRERG